jgi:PAS domain-containing protein
MPTGNEASLMGVVDRIYESVERPELWPKTIRAIGDFVGGKRHFWALEQGSERGPDAKALSEAGCQPSFFLSREDLKALDQYEREFGELIIRFLKIVFLSILWSPNDVGARETLGSIMTRRYVQAFGPSGQTWASSPASPVGRKLIAALWEDGHTFRRDHLGSMRLLAPHLERAMRLQMRLSSADLNAHRVSGAFDALTLGVVLVDGTGRPLWLNKRAQEIIHYSNAIRLCSTGLAGHRGSDTLSLRELVNGAVAGASHGLIAINRGSDLRPLLITAVPLRPQNTQEACDRLACGVIFISDPDRADQPSVESLQRAFDLTNREAQTAIAIAKSRLEGCCTNDGGRSDHGAQSASTGLCQNRHEPSGRTRGSCPQDSYTGQIRHSYSAKTARLTPQRLFWVVRDLTMSATCLLRLRLPTS